MIGMDDLSCKFAEIPEMLVSIAKHQSFCCGIRVGAVAQLSVIVHLITEVEERKGVCFYLASEVLFGLI